jgi:hypothetical protein
MRREFCRRNGLYRRDGWPRPPCAAAHLWPFARAIVATLDVTGIGADTDAELADQLEALERYWDGLGPRPAYASDPPRRRRRPSRFHDDNAWVGLALVSLARLRPAFSGVLERAAQLLEFSLGGWDARRGGVYWVEQGRALGERNRDRNTVSTAPNAQLWLHLRELRAELAGPDAVLSPEAMGAWVLETLDSEGDGLGPFCDKVRGDGSVDRALWSYNQGSMAGLYALLARAGGPRAGEHLRRAEGIAARALERFGGVPRGQPAAFNAIFLRNLLLVHHQTGVRELRARILAALHGYADWACEHIRDERDRFRFGPGPLTLLDQSAAVQVLALAAWDEADYGRLA